MPEDKAAEVIEAIEEYIAVKVQDANKALESKITTLTWLIGLLGGIIAISGLVTGLAPAITKIVHG